MDKTLTTTASGHDNQTGTTIVLLSLFLLILAFFIVLVAISTFEETKSKAVINSLTSTFATYSDTVAKPTDFTSKDGDVLGRQEFQERVTGIFSTAFQVAKVEIVQPGRLMRVTMPTSAMFVDGENRVRPGVLPFFDRITASLGSPAPGLKFDMEFVIGTAYGEDGIMAVEETLEMARAGAFAREMTSRGAPPGSISIGLVPQVADQVGPGQVTLRFYVRTRDSVGAPER